MVEVLIQNQLAAVKLQHRIISNSIFAVLRQIDVVVNTLWIHFMQQWDGRA